METERPRRRPKKQGYSEGKIIQEKRNGHTVKKFGYYESKKKKSYIYLTQCKAQCMISH
jgi:hypothetical protein